MHIVDLAKEYSAKSDEELLRLAAEREELTQTAQTVLSGELAKRRINVAEHLKSLQDEGVEPRAKETASRSTLLRRAPPRVSQFRADVLSVYHNNFWLFMKLVAPAVIIGYIAVLASRHEAREFSRHIPRGIEALRHKTELLEIFLVNHLGFFVSWLAFSVSFGVICSAVRQVGAGSIPVDSFSEVRDRMGAFLRLSLLLYLSMLLLLAIALMLGVGLVVILRAAHVRSTPLVVQAVTVGAVGLALLVLSRFGLAVPALVLDGCGVVKSMFRSDELTEGTWLILAVLLAKSVVGGYLVGMLPFGIASRIPARVLLPSWFPWFLDAASVAGVSVVEPTMFIGFALLYLRMSAPLSTQTT